MQYNVKSATGRITEEYDFILITVFGEKQHAGVEIHK